MKICIYDGFSIAEGLSFLYFKSTRWVLHHESVDVGGQCERVEFWRVPCGAS